MKKKSFGSKVVSAVNVSNKGWMNIGWATILTALGAGLTYLTGVISQIDMQTLGKYGPLVMMVVVPVLSYLRNRIAEMLKNTDKVEPPVEPEPEHPNFNKELDFNMIGKPKK